MSRTVPPLTRGEGRPVADRTRTFRPNYLSFAGTYQCNLSCPHCCVPIEWTDRLDIPTAVRFLEQAHAAGIEVLGFTGGEPFLYPEFLTALTARAAALGFRFDKLMTNGTWFQEDYCEGPGQALIVNPRGEVKPCCGFASDLDQLTIGNIHTDSVEDVILRARKHPYVGKVFREGLTAIRDDILSRDPNAL